MSLASNIRMLTQKHPTIHNGKITTAQPLLTQLTDYIGSSGKTGSSEKPIPGSIKALSHYVQMEWDARNHQYEITGDDSGGLWVIIESWANITDPEWETYLEHITAEWINNITHLIDPPRARRPLRQPCAACGQRWHHDHDGKRTEAVTAWVWTPDGEQIATVENWEVHCESCGAQWAGKEVAKTYWRAVA